MISIWDVIIPVWLLMCPRFLLSVVYLRAVESSSKL